MSDRLTKLRNKLADDGRFGVTTAYKFANLGLLKLTKVGRHTYVRDSDWDAFIAALPVFTPRQKQSGARDELAT